MPPIPEMMRREPPIDHLRMHITRHAQLEPQPSARNLALEVLRHMDDMAEAVRAGGHRLGEVHRDA
jgi:hypothetical protein